MELEIEQLYKFSQNNSHLLITHTDNKAKVYEVENQNCQQFVLENKIVNSQITSADIYVKDSKQIYCAFGNSKGELILYDVNKSKKIFQLQIHQKNIIDICFNESGDEIYTISADKHLKRIDIKLQQETFSKEVKNRGFIEKARILCLEKQNIIYSVDNKITLLNLENNKEILKYTGHSQNIIMLKKNQNNQQFISYSGEGFVNIFNTEQNTPVFTVNVLNQSKISNLDIYTVSKKKILVIIQHVDQIVLADILFEGQNPIQVNQIVKLSSSILYASYDNKNNALNIVSGSTANAKIKSIQLFESQQQKNKKTQKITSVKKQLSIEQIQSEVDVLLENKQKIQKNNGNQVQKDQTNTYVVGENDFDKEKENLILNENDKDDQLEKIGILSNLKQYADAKIESENDINNVKSLAAVLLQGLHNNDQQLLDFCLEKDDDELIENTVKKILPGKVGKLIENVTDRLSRFPYKASTLCKWLKYIVKYHNSILISTPQVHKKLGPLMQMIESRTKNLNKIIALRGKIDMVLSLKRAQQNKQQQQVDEVRPVTLYQEGDEEIVEEDKHIAIETDEQEGVINDSISDSEAEDEEDLDEEFDQAAQQDLEDGLEEEQDIEEDSDYAEF